MEKIKVNFAYFFSNKLYMGMLLLIAIATYGYEIVHAAVGIDDICIGRYFADGSGLSIGRWPFFLFDQLGIFGLDTYIPFLADLMAVFILILVCIGWCCLFKGVFDRNFITVNIWCYIIFSIFFISYSLIAYVFIYYLHNGIALANLCIVTALLLWDDIHYNKNYKMFKIIVILGMVTLAISFYESFASVFIMAFCILGGVNECFERSKFFGFMKQLLYMCITLFIAILCRKRICVILGRIYNKGLWMREAKIAGRFQGEIEEVIDNVRLVLIMNFEKYIKNIDSNPILLLDIAIIIIVVSAIYLGIKKKNMYFLGYAVISILSLFLISIFSGAPIYERSTQNMPLFIGFAFSVLVFYMINRKAFFKIVTGIVIIVLEWNNLCMVNFLFYSESKNNERSVAIIRDIGNRVLQRGGNEKGIVFVGSLSEKGINFEAESEGKYLYINQGIITWGESAFEENGTELINFFQLYGYDFYMASEEELVEAQKIANEMPTYPDEGCILVCEEYVIVKLGEVDG